MSRALDDIAAERRRQIEVRGWTTQHDDAYLTGELAQGAAAYAYAASGPDRSHGRLWPWEAQFWKPGDPRRMLVKAAALVVAEIERLDRACTMCDGYGYKDHAWLKTEPCDHQRPFVAPRPESNERHETYLMRVVRAFEKHVNALSKQIRAQIRGMSPCAEGEASDRLPPEHPDDDDSVSKCEACGKPCPEDRLHVDGGGFSACEAAFTDDGSGDCPNAEGAPA